MAEKNDKHQQNNSENANPSEAECTSTDCCPPKKNENKTVKWALFGIIMLAAIGIGSTTLVRKMNNANAPAAGGCAPGDVCKDGGVCKDGSVCKDGGVCKDGSACKGGGVCKDGSACKEGGVCKDGTPCKSSKSGSVKSLCGKNLPSMNEFNDLTGDKNIAFILLPGDNNEKANTVAANVNSFVEKKTKDKNDIAVFTLKNDAGGHDQLIKNFGITSFPSVVVLGRGCKSLAVSDKFTEEVFTNALTMARTPMSNCGSTCTH